MPASSPPASIWSGDFKYFPSQTIIISFQRLHQNRGTSWSPGSWCLFLIPAGFYSACVPCPGRETRLQTVGDHNAAQEESQNCCLVAAAVVLWLLITECLLLVLLQLLLVMWTRFVIVALKHFRTITNTTEQMNHSHLATPGSGGAERYKESSTFSLLSRECMA